MGDANHFTRKNVLDKVACLTYPYTMNIIDFLRKLHKRWDSVRDLINAPSAYIIITRNEDQTRIQHNFEKPADLIHLLAHTANELHKAEQSIDAVINELGIKRVDH